MATINARIDDDIKAKADEVLKTYDISHTQAITAFYQYIARNGCLPFTITMQVEEMDDKIIQQFRKASAILNSFRSNIDVSGKLVWKDIREEYDRLKKLHVTVWNEIPQSGSRYRFISVADALKEAISVLVDFKKFGYGYQEIEVTSEENRKFSTSVALFEEQIKKFQMGIGEDYLAETDILALDQEVRNLERWFNESRDDQNLSKAEKKAITNEYTIKYQMHELVGLRRVSVR